MRTGEIGISFRCTLCKSSLSAPCQILKAYIWLWEPDPVLSGSVRAVPWQIVARSRQATIPDHHRQAEKLWCCQSNDPARRYPRYPTICQQSPRSAHSEERTTNAPIQITPTSSALSVAPRCRPKSILRCATLAEIDSSPTLEVSVLRSLANGNGGLTISNSRRQSAQTRSE